MAITLAVASSAEVGSSLRRLVSNVAAGLMGNQAEGAVGPAWHEIVGWDRTIRVGARDHDKPLGTLSYDKPALPKGSHSSPPLIDEDR